MVPLVCAIFCRASIRVSWATPQLTLISTAILTHLGLCIDLTNAKPVCVPKVTVFLRPWQNFHFRGFPFLYLFFSMISRQHGGWRLSGGSSWLGNHML